MIYLQPYFIAVHETYIVIVSSKKEFTNKICNSESFTCAHYVRARALIYVTWTFNGLPLTILDNSLNLVYEPDRDFPRIVPRVISTRDDPVRSVQRYEAQRDPRDAAGGLEVDRWKDAWLTRICRLFLPNSV